MLDGIELPDRDYGDIRSPCPNCGGEVIVFIEHVEVGDREFCSVQGVNHIYGDD